MINELESAMRKQSRNFGFMRPKCEQLAEAGASVEMHAHDDDPLTALSEARRFAEGLLKFYVRHRSDEREPDGFEALITACSAKRLLPEEQLKEFDKLRFDLNRPVHDLGHLPKSSPLEYAKRIWTLAKWVWEELKLGGTVPAEFIQIPPGGVERHNTLTEIHAPFEPRNWFDPSQDVERLLDFVPRELVFNAVEQFVSQNQQRLLLIKGPLGCGKSTLLAEFIQTSRSNGITCITFFFNKIHHQGRPRVWIQHIYAKFVQTYEAEIKELAKNVRDLPPSDLVNRLSNRLSEFADPTQRMLFVIDAVDEAGTAKDDVVSFLRSSLPKGVQIIATVRPDNLPVDLDPANDRDPTGISRVDLRRTEFVYASRKDGRSFVERRLKSVRFSDGTLAEIARLGDGNFLTLRGLATEILAKKLSDSAVIGWLHDLARSGKIGEELTAELDLRAWERFKNSPDSIRIVGLLAFAYTKLSTEMILDSLGLKGDWDQLKQPVDEYLLRSEYDSVGPDHFIRYQLFHPAFAAFVREKLKRESRTLETKLANVCRRWIRAKKTGYARDYALQFAVQHLIDAEAWSDLVELLTDLDFVEARFTSGQGYELLEDYELALRKHPERRAQFDRRDEQDEKLRQWVEELVKYSRNCTKIRGSHARGEISDPVAEAEKLKLPEPIDTTATIADMKKADTAQHAHSRRHRNLSDAAASLFEFRSFIRSQFDNLNEVPRSTFGLAKSFAEKGSVAEAVGRVERDRPTAPILRRTVALPSQSDQSMVLSRIGSGVEFPETCIRWMTPDARIVVGCGIEQDPDFIWDLRSGRKLLNDLEANFPGVTLDGQYAVTITTRTISLRDLTTGNVRRGVEIDFEDSLATYWAQPYRWGVTPDGSLVVFPSGDELVIWSTDSNDLSNRIDLQFLDNHEFLDFVLCHSGCVAALCHRCSTSPIHWTFFDLLKQECLQTVSESELMAYLEAQWFRSDFLVARWLAAASRTADGELRIVATKEGAWPHVINQRIERSNGDTVRRFDPSFPFGEFKCISADGRYAVADKWGDCYLLDLADGVWPKCDPTGNQPEMTVATTANIANSSADKGAQTAEWVPDEELLRAELQFGVQGTARQAPGCVLLSPDGSYLFSDHRSMSQSDDEVAVSEAHHSDFDADDEERLGPNVRLPNEATPATATDLSSGRTREIKPPRQMLNVTRDGKCVVFTGDCEDWGDRLTFWGIDRQDWLPSDKEYALNFQFDARHESSLIGHPRGLQSPDGRVLLLPGCEFEGEFILVRLNARDQKPKVLAQRRWRFNSPQSWFSPDGRFLVQLYVQTAYLWTVPDGECIGVIERPELNAADLCVPDWIDCEGILRDKRYRDTRLRIENPQPTQPWVTGVRLFRAKSTDGEQITFLCPAERKRIELPDKVIKTIDAITKKYDVNVSPVLDLPDKAWDDEPCLDFDCPKCGQKLRSTPFYVDRL